jgi:hypothetical protein
MMPGWLRLLRTNKWISTALILMLLPLAVLSVMRGVFKGSRVACDMQHVWLSGLLVSMGHNPYRVYLEDKALIEELTPPNADPDNSCPAPLYERPPFNAPLLAVLMVPFGRLDLHTARLTWLVVQIAFAIVLPLMMLRCNLHPPHWRLQLIFVLLMLAWAPTRAALSAGQNSVLMALPAFLAIWLAYRERPLWAGLLMGVALSKYTLTGALLLFFLLYRHYRVIGIAVLMHVLGIVVMAFLVHESPVEIVQTYLGMLQSVVGQFVGVVSADRWLEVIRVGKQAAAIVAFVLGVVITVVFVIPKYLKQALGRDQSLAHMPYYARVKSNLLIVISLLIGLFFVYHRHYDMPILFFYLTFVAGLDLSGELSREQTRLYTALMLTAALIIAAMMLPPRFMGLFVADGDEAVVAVNAITLVVALVVSIWVLHRFDALVPQAQRPVLEPAERT